MKVRHSLLCGHMTGLAVFLFIVFPLAAQAGRQSAVIVDGRYEEWDLDKDCSTPMRSGSNCTGESTPNVYLRYDSITNTVFVLVLQNGFMQDGRSKPIVNIYTLGQNMPIDLSKNGKISDFSWVVDGGKRVGWEGSFQLAPGTYDCDTGARSTGEVDAVSERKSASEVEVIDTEGLFFKCK